MTGIRWEHLRRSYRQKMPVASMLVYCTGVLREMTIKASSGRNIPKALFLIAVLLCDGFPAFCQVPAMLSFETQQAALVGEKLSFADAAASLADQLHVNIFADDIPMKRSAAFSTRGSGRLLLDMIAGQ